MSSYSPFTIVTDPLSPITLFDFILCYCFVACWESICIRWTLNPHHPKIGVQGAITAWMSRDSTDCLMLPERSGLLFFWVQINLTQPIVFSYTTSWNPSSFSNGISLERKSERWLIYSRITCSINNYWPRFCFLPHPWKDGPESGDCNIVGNHSVTWLLCTTILISPF